jgi:hypothetical protein
MDVCGRSTVSSFNIARVAMSVDEKWRDDDDDDDKEERALKALRKRLNGLVDDAEEELESIRMLFAE